MTLLSNASSAGRRFVFCLLIVVTLWSPDDAHAQPPRGYYFGPAVSLPDSVREVLGEGRFTYTVNRVARSELQRKLLNDAERLFPDTSSINRVVSTVSNQPTAQRLASAALVPGDRWWWESITGVWTPFALTGSAVDYYRRQIDEFIPLAPLPPGALRSGAFEYRASVDTVRGDSVATHVVRLSMRWRFLCGQLCGVAFTKSRDVFFRNDGSVLRVEGDGVPVVSVS